MATTLLTHFKMKITSFELIPSDGGCFEIDVNGERIYSKLDQGEFPDETMIVKTVERKA